MTSSELDTSTASKIGPNTSKPGNSNDESDSLGTLDLSASFRLTHKGREDKRLKAMRMLVTGRLRVLRVDRDLIVAECRGDSGEIYNLFWKDQRWTCSCPARTDCSHLNALWGVVAVNRG